MPCRRGGHLGAAAAPEAPAIPGEDAGYAIGPRGGGRGSRLDLVACRVYSRDETAQELGVSPHEREKTVQEAIQGKVTAPDRSATHVAIPAMFRTLVEMRSAIASSIPVMIAWTYKEVEGAPTGGGNGHILMVAVATPTPPMPPLWRGRPSYRWSRSAGC